jgi:hypothetical protein
MLLQYLSDGWRYYTSANEAVAALLFSQYV